MQNHNEPLHRLQQLFMQKKCWTIEQLCQTMNYSATSIRRFLKELGYFSSFTHNSKWYTLSFIPDFNKEGIWFYEDIGFSKHGNLKKTILHLINKSTLGLSAKQLTEKLSTFCHAVLNHLYEDGVIDRFKGEKCFIYLSSDPKKKDRQLKRIKLRISESINPSVLSAQAAVYVLIEFIKNPLASFFEISKAVAKKNIIATPESIARFFEEHDLKKTLN